MIRAVRPDGTIETGGAFAPIRRPRVLERLAGAALQRIVLLTAPAGYGKSVALRQFLAERNDSILRFDVQNDHSTLLGFLRGFSEAVAPVAPQARDTLAGAYDANASSPNAGVDLALWMHSHIRTFRGTIAIDDLHIAQEDREVTKFLTSLIERTKDRVQWIIASRATTGLPIGTWLAYGESDMAVDEKDLEFTAEEVRDAARAFRLAVRDEELAELLKLTDGWATAISFALRTSTRSVDIRSISATTRDMVFHYLAEQVYASLGEEERRFLEVATQLQRIDIRLLVAAGFNDATALVDRLQSRVAFLHQEESEPGVYRCHDLFRDFIARQIDLQGHAYASELRITLAKTLEGNGLFREAIALYTAAEAKDALEALLAREAMALLAHGAADIVERALPLVEQSERPEILAARGLFALSRGRADEGERLLQAALRITTNAQLRSDVALRLARYRLNRGVSAQDLLDDIINDEDAPYNAKLEAMSMVAIANVRGGDGAVARNFITAVEARMPDVVDRELRARLAQRIGLAWLELKEYERAGTLLENAAEIASETGLWSLAANAFQSSSYFMLFGRNDTASALWMAQQAANAAEKAGDINDLVRAHLSMLSIETRRGNIERASAVEKALTALRASDPSTLPYIASSQAHRSAWSGDVSNAHRLFASVLDRQFSAYDRAFVRAAYGFCLALDGRTSESQKAVDAFFLLADDETLFPADDDSVQLEAGRLLSIVAEAVAGRHTRVLKMLKGAPRSQHPVASHMHRITEQVTRAAKSPSYVPDGLGADFDAIHAAGYGIYARYLEQAEAHVSSAHEPKLPAVRLTPQEVKIVRLLAKGLSPKDIATELGRSVYTVQTHIQNVIEKLGCHGRAEAIATAGKLGIL